MSSFATPPEGDERRNEKSYRFCIYHFKSLQTFLIEAPARCCPGGETRALVGAALQTHADVDGSVATKIADPPMKRDMVSPRAEPR
ncbi:MAG: hypothetical protein NVS1B5_04190 [Gemmatimonadaceae bacterium]